MHQNKNIILRIALASLPDGAAEGEEAQQNQRRDDHDAGGRAARKLGQGADQEGAHKGRPLAADVQQAVVFARALRRDDLAEVGAGQRLDAALEHPHADSQHPELALGAQEDGVGRDAHIGQDAHRDKEGRVHPAGQPAEQQRKGKRHDLGHQQRQQQPGAVQAQSLAVGGGHVDDGVHAVDVEEKGDKECAILIRKHCRAREKRYSLRLCRFFHLCRVSKTFEISRIPMPL